MEFKFNIRGHLFPYEIIETDLDEFESEFVDNFDENSTRNEIFERYLNYIGVLKEVLKKILYNGLTVVLSLQKSIRMILIWCRLFPLKFTKLI